MYLYDGRMIAPPSVECDMVTYRVRNEQKTVNLPAVLSSAWEGKDGSRVLILVNPSDTEHRCKVDGTETVIPPLDAVLVEM